MAAYRYVESSFRLSLSRSSRDSHAYRRFSYGTEAVGAVPIDEPLHKGADMLGRTRTTSHALLTKIHAP